MLSVIFVGALCLFFAYVIYAWFQRPANFPPGPRGLPILGVLPFLGKFPEREFSAWSKKYGPLLSVPMGLQNWIVLNDYDIIVETLVKRSEEFNERPYVRYLQAVAPNGIAFTTGGPSWLSHRKFGVAALRRFGGNKGVMERKINEEVRYLIEKLGSFEGKPTQVEDILTSAVANIICNIAFGKRYTYDDPKFQTLVTTLMELHWKTNVVMGVQFLCDVPPFSQHVKKSSNAMQPIKDMVRELLEEHKKTYDPGDIRDMMDSYLETFQHEKGNFVYKNFQDTFAEFFAAGTETTSSTLRWAFLCLMIHHDVQEKMHEEIERVIGTEGTPSLLHRERMPYSCAVLHEVQRFRTVGALSVPRCTSKDVTVRGFRIPKGTNVMTNLWNVHNDDTYWKEPQNFTPQRHLDENGNFTNSRHVMPFGAGARVCLGENLARAELWLILISVIQKFRISVDHNRPEKPSLDRGSNGIAYVPEPFHMILISR